MRAFVLALAVLAGLKLWANQELYRSAADQALLHAYASHAVAACQAMTNTEAAVASSTAPFDWASYHAAHVEIGDKDTKVRLWQVDHELWDRRYKTPFILLVAQQAQPAPRCTYNVMTGEAVLHAA